MQMIKNKTFDEERALYAAQNLFVQDCAFDGPADGIQRAMKQLYPLMDKGKIQKLTFIERRH